MKFGERRQLFFCVFYLIYLLHFEKWTGGERLRTKKSLERRSFYKTKREINSTGGSGLCPWNSFDR